MKSKILIVGNVMSSDGYGNFTLDLLTALKDTKKFRISFYGFCDVNLAKLGIDVAIAGETFDIQIVCSPPFSDAGMKLTKNLFPSKFRVIYTMWESRILPKLWDSRINDNFDSCWWTAAYNLGNGVTIPEFHINPGLNTARRIITPKKDEKVRNWTLLANAAWDDTRKNYEQQVKCFLAATKKSDHLTVKLNGKQPEHIKSDRITFINDKISDNELNSLYAKTDIFLYLSRGEGYGLPPREAGLAESIIIIGDTGDGMQDLCHDPILSIKPSGEEMIPHWSGTHNITTKVPYPYPVWDDKDIISIYKYASNLSKQKLRQLQADTKSYIIKTCDNKLKVEDIVCRLQTILAQKPAEH